MCITLKPSAPPAKVPTMMRNVPQKFMVQSQGVSPEIAITQDSSGTCPAMQESGAKFGQLGEARKSNFEHKAHYKIANKDLTGEFPGSVVAHTELGQGRQSPSSIQQTHNALSLERMTGICQNVCNPSTWLRTKISVFRRGKREKALDRGYE